MPPVSLSSSYCSPLTMLNYNWWTLLLSYYSWSLSCPLFSFFSTLGCLWIASALSCIIKGASCILLHDLRLWFFFEFSARFLCFFEPKLCLSCWDTLFACESRQNTIFPLLRGFSYGFETRLLCSYLRHPYFLYSICKDLGPMIAFRED